MEPDILSILSASAIFEDFNEAQLTLVAALCDPLTFPGGAEIVRENEASDELYVIAQGSVLVTMAADAAARSADAIILAELGIGQVVGEIALVDRGVRSATVRAKEDDTMLLRIRRDHLIALSETYPLLGYRLMRNLAIDLAAKIRTTDWLVRHYQMQAQASGRSES